MSVLLSSPVNRSHQLARGLANAWLPLRAGGVTLFDALGRNHAALVNGPTWNRDANGLGAVRYLSGGSEDYATFTAVSGSAWTWGFRFSRERDTTYEQMIAGSSGGAWIGMGGGSGQYYFALGGVSFENTLSGNRSGRAWQTMVVSYATVSSGLRLTLNGVTTAASGTPAGSVSFDRFAKGTFYPFEGSLGAAWYWPATLTDSQAAAFCREADAGFPTLLNRDRRRPRAVSVAAGGGGDAAFFPALMGW